jgi:sulfur carrier protein
VTVPGDARPSDAGDGEEPLQPGPIVNGAPWDAGPDATVADAVAAWCASPRGVAVAVNGTVVPRSSWATTVLAPGDRVEIVTAAAGG